MTELNEKYDVRIDMDDLYTVNNKDDYSNDYLFRGTLTEVNAWLELQKKGFNID